MVKSIVKSLIKKPLKSNCTSIWWC